MEWLLLLPKLGFLPQITHTLDMPAHPSLKWSVFESAIVCRRRAAYDKGPRPTGAIVTGRYDRILRTVRGFGEGRRSS